MPQESSPTIKFGMINIVTSYPGVNPVDMDTLITTEIEDAIDDIEGIKKISSSSKVGMANTVAELYNDVEASEVLVDIKDAVDKIDLPTDANDPIVTEISTSNELMFELLLYGEPGTFPPQRLKEVANQFKDQLEGKYGIATFFYKE